MAHDTGYHGTSVQAGISDKILPPSKHGKPRVYPGLSDDTTYFTSKETPAWGWATATGGRPVVYETEPHPHQAVDFNWHDVRTPFPQADHFISPEQTVKRQIDIPPPGVYGDAVQGTLPPVNWNQFGGDRYDDHNYKGLYNSPPEYGDTEPAPEKPKRSEIPGQQTLF